MNRVVRNILWGALYTFLLVTAGSYFYFAYILREKGRSEEVCKSFKVTLLDSSLNRFVTKDEVVDIIEGYHNGKTIGMKIDSVKLKDLEMLLNKKSAIKESEVFINRDGTVNIEITQRKPIIRIETLSGGYYIDESGYIFPLIENCTSFVPIVTGNLPVDITEKRELIGKDSVEWINKFVKLGKYLEQNAFWNAQIEQIYFEKENCAELYTRVGDQKIVFGDIKDIEPKFKKLYAFYLNALPELGWDRYSSIDLSFKGQIVCKKEK